MESQSPLIKVLKENETKILERGKYNKNQYDFLIRSLTDAENTRNLILNKIKELGRIDLDKMQEDLGLSREILDINIDYLRELGMLAFLGEHPRFFKDIIENSDHSGLFPSSSHPRDQAL